MKIKIYTEELTKRDEEEAYKEEEGFMLFFLESEDMYLDLKESMETMVEHQIHHLWRRVVVVDDPVEKQAGGDRFLRGKIQHGSFHHRRVLG